MMGKYGTVAIKMSLWSLLSFAVAILLQSCAAKKKIQELVLNDVGVGVSIAGNVVMENLLDTLHDVPSEERVALVDRLGKAYVVDAVKDDELGEMVISEKLGAVVVEAKFRNVAERNGQVDIAFDVKVPAIMQASEWQVRITPVIDYLGQKVELDKVYVTGDKYRANQLRGYELYEKFLSSIIPSDTGHISIYTNKRLLELFIERNFKEISQLKNDTSIVDESLESELFGVTARQVIEHYTKEYLIRRNERRIANKERMYAKYVKVPLENGGIRLDSVINNPDSSVVYHYTHTIRAQRGLKRVDLVLAGEIYQSDKLIYTMPATGPLTYYISSLASLADNSTRFVKRIIERNVVANTVSYIDFKAGEHKVRDTLRNNAAELASLRKNIKNILEDKTYAVDSLIITSSCSPEGKYSANEILAEKRALAIKDYFISLLMSYSDSLNNEFWEISLDEEPDRNSDLPLAGKIGTRWIVEGWEELSLLIQQDSNITDRHYIENCMLIQDPDKREMAMLESVSGKYIKEMLYPCLRCVKFDFYMHRKGMLKDTIHTTEIDTLYMKGISALHEKDYKTAVTLLAPYRDINAAVAYICMDYNSSALSILDELPQNALCNYMKSIVYARLGSEHRAVEHFILAVKQNPSMKHRGNLDPEISSLLKKYQGEVYK